MQSTLNPMGPGKIFYVVNAADTEVYNYLSEMILPDTDGTIRLYSATSLTADVAIQAALDACVANRNDYVVIMPSSTNYSITTAISVSKKGVHIVCPTGLGGNFPIGNTARLKSIVAATPVFAIAANTEAVEIAGLYIKNYADVAAITVDTGCSALNIHNNMFPMVWTTSPVASIVGTGSAFAWSSIEHNQWISETGSQVTAAIAAINIQTTATGARVCHNEVTLGDRNVATVAISNLAAKGHTDFNVFSESGGAAANIGGGSYGGTITKCIAISTSACAIGNLGAVATTHMVTGGTAAISYSENYDGHDATAANGSVVA